ncbi:MULTISPECIES: copper resistance protein CopC [unclassified Streptomyces]|uniref:copper resistance CopC family protein n=1 Tax=unclassified Streptomyces TaxID=2593676 RepID=UPI003814A5B9
MDAFPRRAARTAARALTVPLALGTVALAAPLAAAHTGLENSSPERNTSLGAPPDQVVLTFTDPMAQKYAQVAVTAADGTTAALGAPRVSGREVSLALRPDALAGRYTVGYRVVSADGHPVSGSYTFTVEASRQTQQARPTRPPRPEKPTSPTRPTPLTRPTTTAAGPSAAGPSAAGTETSAPTDSGSPTGTAASGRPAPGQGSSPGTPAVLAGAGLLALVCALGVFAARRRRTRSGD